MLEKIFNKDTLIGAGIIVIALLGGFLYFRSQSTPGDLGTFAQCLKDKGAVFYGASWCSHCQNQKKSFGTAADKLPYVECATPDGKGQEQVCKDNNITGYPTWVFPDGSRQSGEVPMKTLAEKTGCALAQ